MSQDKQYVAFCRDPETGEKATFNITARNSGNADMQARDGYFGLLAVPSDRYSKLEVELHEYEDG